MAIQNEPTRISTPFADAGTKNVIPETMAQPSATAAASWQAGFPTVCSLPLSAGGIPPARNDFNGLFNQLSQTSRFLQDGGIFAWNATTDYGANRLVLGSDGNLYWSVAQSGPNTGAGAVDPTTDSGAYWGSMPMKTPGLGDDGDGLVTASWVRALATSPVYLDPAGDDANDGMSAAKAVKTFQRAIALAMALPNSFKTIVVSSGTYNGNLETTGLYCNFILQGNITINGRVFIHNNSAITFTDNYTVTVVATNVTDAIAVDTASYLSALSTSFVVTATNITYNGLSIAKGSTVYMQSFHLSGTSSTAGVLVSGESYLLIGDSLDIDDILTTGRAIAVEGNSYLEAISNTQKTIYTSTTNMAVTINSISGANIKNLTINHKSTADVVMCTNNSFIHLSGIKIAASATANSFLGTSDCSYVLVDTSIDFSGAVNFCTAYCANNSVLTITPAATVTGTVTGQRYAVGHGGMISVGGAGANRIPGTTAGVASSGSYGFYD